MKISEKIDAEFINSAVFKIIDRIYKKQIFYKCGLLILSENSSELEKYMDYVDFLTGRIDGYIIRNEMKKALIYTVLLKRRVDRLTSVVDKTEIDLPDVP